VTRLRCGGMVGWSLTSLFSTNMAISEMKMWWDILLLFYQQFTAMFAGVRILNFGKVTGKSKRGTFFRHGVELNTCKS